MDEIWPKQVFLKNILLMSGILVLAGCALLTSPSRRPDWIENPKTEDGAYSYQLGQATGRSSASIAREAALRDARTALARKIGCIESNLTCKVVAGALYMEKTVEGWSCWLQVSTPLVQGPGGITATPESSNKPPSGLTQLPKQPNNLQTAELDLGQGVKLAMVYIADLKLWVGKYEVTVEQYQLFLHETLYEGRKDADSNYLKHIQGKDETLHRESYPIVWISWNNAVKCCDWLAEKTSYSFRLPTEDEWECACRAGTTTSYCWGDIISLAPQYAWFSGNSGCLQETGRKTPNAYGLHDMTGNAWEWCSDWFDEDYYKNSPTNNPQGPNNGNYGVLRGGCWFQPATFCRSADRNVGYSPPGRNNNYGFRCASSP